MWWISKSGVGASLAILILMTASGVLAEEMPRDGAQCRVPLLALDAYAEVVRARELLALSRAGVAAMERLAAWQMVAGDVDRDDRELTAGIVQRQKDAAAYLRRDEHRVRQAEGRLARVAGLAVPDWVTIKELEGLLRSGSAVRQVAQGGLRLPCDPVPASVRRMQASLEVPEPTDAVGAEGVAFLAEKVDNLEKQRDLQQRAYTTGKPILRFLLATRWELMITRRRLVEARFRQVMQGFREAHPGVRLAETDTTATVPAATASSRSVAEALPASDPPAASPVSAAKDPEPPLTEAVLTAAPPAAGLPEPAEAAPSATGAPAVATEASPSPKQETPASPSAESPPQQPEAAHSASESPVVAPTSETDDPVRAAVFAWRDAWQARDIPAYLAHYAADFRPGRGWSRAQWERYRRRVIGKARNIHIAIENLTVERQGSRAVARFHQRYQASNYRDETDKELVLQREQGEWKIVAERSR